MTSNQLSIAPGVIIERIGDDVLVIVPRSTDVMRLSDDAARTIRAIQAGHAPVLPTATVTELVERGVLVSEAGMSRRGLIKAGAIGAGAGIAVLAMPSVAAASSGPSGVPLVAIWAGPDGTTGKYNIEITNSGANATTFPPNLGGTTEIEIQVSGQSSSFSSNLISETYIFFVGVSASPAFSGILTGSMTIDEVLYTVTINPV
jgi:hypothetical protein